MLVEHAFRSAAVLLETIAFSITRKIFWDDPPFLASGVAAIFTLAFSLRYEEKPARWPNPPRLASSGANRLPRKRNRLLIV